MNLKNNVVLLTGAAGFLGGYFTKALRDAGATVIASDVTDQGDVVLDVTDQASIDSAFDRIVSEHGRIDVVINNAAIDPKFDASADHNDLTFTEYPEEAMRQSVDVNLLGTWRVCKAAIRQMKAQGPSDDAGHAGTIVNVASFYGITPPRQELYEAGKEKPVDYPMTKAGIVMLTRHIASQFGRDGIRVNALAPGGVVRDHDQAFQDRYGAHTSLGRMNTPEEVTDALLFLASDASGGMTGETLAVDAGWRSR